MKGWPANIKSWGIDSILKEAARILYKHFRLFLPFFVAIDLPLTIIGLCMGALLPPPSPGTQTTDSTGRASSLITSNALVPAPQEGALSPDANSTWLLDYSVLTLVECSVFEKLLLGAWTYVVAYIYSDNYIEADPNSIVKRVFKLLPSALFRMVVTGLWFFLLTFVGCLVTIGLSVVLILIQAGVGPPPHNPNWIFVITYTLFEILLFVCILHFALSDSVAVFEPQNYGREALSKSFKLVKEGSGRLTAFSILVLKALSVALLSLPLQQFQLGVADGTLPLWKELLYGFLLVIVSSAITTYFGVCLILVYFVCKSRVGESTISICEHLFSSRSLDESLLP